MATTSAWRVEDAIELRLAAGNGYRLGHLTGRAGPELGPRDVFAAVAEAIACHGIQPVQEKVYGRLEAKDELVALRRAAYGARGLDPDLPFAFHEGRPLERDEFAGVQVWGVVPDGPGVAVTTDGGGRTWTGEDYRVLVVPGIDGRPAGGVTGEAGRMLRRTRAALAGHGLSFRNVVRTWIYLKRILDWYGEFNRVRTAFFAEEGVGSDEARSFPASTGIQGTASGEECSMDLMAVEGAGAVVRPIHGSERQRRAFEYGSAFSRAMSVEIGGLETIHVSGTASIDSAGRTIHRDDPQAQILETLLCISALLAMRGGSLRDVRLATLFCKTPDVLDHYRTLERLLDLPALPVVPVQADVCRADLLVEIEAIAVVEPAERKRP